MARRTVRFYTLAYYNTRASVNEGAGIGKGVRQMVTLAENPRTDRGCRRAARARHFFAASRSSAVRNSVLLPDMPVLRHRDLGSCLGIDHCPLAIERSATPGTPAITYIWGETLIQQDNAAGTANAGIYYLIADAHGSTRLVLNDSGTVVQTCNYDVSGNALGFTPSGSITPYLYNQQFFDIVSGQYYLRSRNYDPATGTFTQQDTISLAPGDLANANLFLFAGADPVNMFDPSGHDLMETPGSLAIQSMIGSIISPVIAPFASDALGLLIPSWVTQGMLDAVPDAALIGGNLSALWRAGASPFSLGITGGLDLLLSAKDHYAALYDYAGGSLGIGGAGSRSIGGNLAVGAVWRAPRSGDYSGSFISATVPFTSDLFPASLRNRLRDILTTTFVSEKLLSVIGTPLPGEAAPGEWDLLNYVQYNLHQINSAIQQAESWISRASITLFFAPSPPYSFGFSVGIGASATSLTGGSSPASLSFTFYHQLWDAGSGASNGW
jgi:RHS repeat-associated protein